MKTPHLILSLILLGISPLSLSAASSERSADGDAPKGFVIQRGDEISVRVFAEHVPQVTLGVRGAIVDAKGEIRLGGVADPIQVAEKPLSEVADALRKSFERTGLTSVSVSVIVRKDG